EQVRRRPGTARLHDDERAAVIGVGPGQDDPPLIEQAIHEGGVLVPQRLLASGHSGHPRWPRLTKDEEERAGGHGIPPRPLPTTGGPRGGAVGSTRQARRSCSARSSSALAASPPSTTTLTAAAPPAAARCGAIVPMCSSTRQVAMPFDSRKDRTTSASAD